VDDRTVGLIIRALRRRRGWRQADLAGRASVSQSTVSRAERGRLQNLSLGTIRALFAALEAGVLLAPRWRGAELERLLDEDHSMVVDAVATRLEGLGWTVEAEVTYSEFGERGSIDVLGVRPAARAIVVLEVKTDIASSEALGRKLDEKARLAPRIVNKRLGWRAEHVGRVLVMPETMRLRRLVERHPTIGRMFPGDALAVRRWLRNPVGTVAGMWFLSFSDPRTVGGAHAASRRRIRAQPSVESAPSDPFASHSAANPAAAPSKSPPVSIREEAQPVRRQRPSGA
jgi:transcriptional regulator with XRE-family HTH domain